MRSAELIAQTLREENVKATFFLANEKTFRGDYSLDPAWDGYWKRLADEGHRFGNHTWSHLYARGDEGGKVIADNGSGERVALDRGRFCEELARVDKAFERATARRLSGLWRAPGWRTTYQSMRFAASCGYPLHVGTDDAGYIRDDLPSEQVPNQQLLERALKKLRGGDVITMHLGIESRKEPAAPILKPLIQGLKKRGLCFATLDVAQR
jgi:peptidoglycan/xylan/chitin deacetylase (PgdA/CDA1 family)